jgi:multiple antibiotic resistance protein
VAPSNIAHLSGLFRVPTQSSSYVRWGFVVYHPHVDVFSAVVTLFLIMDPLGNIPLFLSVLKVIPPERRRRVLIREIVFAYLVLLMFVFLGNYILRFLGLEQETISISGGIVLFLIAIRMIFPGDTVAGDSPEGEPFIVPLAVPLFAGPSVFAALLLMERSAPANLKSLLLAMTIAWALSGAILLASTFFYRILRERGLIAVERLMGMLLVMVAVQMLMNGAKTFLAR